MIVKSFRAENVFDYLNFNITFNKDISFLVGGNGSGKTTALKLMNALVAPNFRDLLQIPFKKISLVVENNKELTEISAELIEEHVILRINSIDEQLALPSYSNIEYEYGASDKLEETFDVLTRKYADHKIIKKISEIQSPIFLGLDRRHDNFSGGRNDYYHEREIRMRIGGRALGPKRSIQGSLGVSLMETELLVQNAYRRLREVEDRQSNKLRDSILLSTFKYSIFAPENSPPLGSWKEKAGLLKRQQEIKEALSKIGVRDSRLSSGLDEFFTRITSLFEGLASKDGGNQIEWLLNKAQIDRMSRIVEIIDEHRSKLEDIFRPINQFLQMVNDFFKDSNKTLELDTVGQLVITRPNGKKSTIDGLSSGERQLLVIFAHAFFNRSHQKETVFIIDEPELSLHLLWQEKFSAAILAINPISQFILATHSPEIVGSNKNKTVQCR